MIRTFLGTEHCLKMFVERMPILATTAGCPKFCYYDWGAIKFRLALVHKVCQSNQSSYRSLLGASLSSVALEGRESTTFVFGVQPRTRVQQQCNLTTLDQTWHVGKTDISLPDSENLNNFLSSFRCVVVGEYPLESLLLGIKNGTFSSP